MNSTQLCSAVTHYIPTPVHTLSSTSATIIGATGVGATTMGLCSNQLPPTTNISSATTIASASASAALGYINGILYLEHDATNATNTTKPPTQHTNPNSHSLTQQHQQHQQQQQQQRQRQLKPPNMDGNNMVHAEFKNDVDHKKVSIDYDDDNIDNADHEDETDSFASMETLSDNVAIWVDGEKHWISGVDSNTTCADLICALLSYQDGQQMFANAAQPIDESANKNINNSNNQNNNNNNNNNSNNNTNNKNNNNNSDTAGNNSSNNPINQSTTNTKEDISKNTQTTNTINTTVKDMNMSAAPGVNHSLNDYVIVKQHRHCEEYLDGSTKVFDVLPTRDITDRKECELTLRRLAASPLITTQVASLLSTDKDSGIAASPVGSARSARFRRRKHKSSNWLAQSNTLHPKLAQRGNYTNERLLKIILAQDETIHRQLSLLREKERQISKIEEEKHRVRERELGKNYLLETYLNGLDEAEVEPDLCDGVEIFIDEPYHQFPATEITTKTTVKTTKEVNSQPTAKTKSSQKIKQKQQKQRKQCKNEDFRISTEETYNDEVSSPPTDSTANGNPKEIELQILWLEKVYAINKQLQREEEILVKLHAKIRKHQVKRAYQTKNEVLQQIDKLDTEIALQCCDIRKVEDNLMTTDEQLKQKLNILEKLNEEFDATATTKATTTMNAQPIALATAANKVAEDLDEITEIKDAVSSCDIRENCSPVTCNANSFETNKLTQPQQRQHILQQQQQQHENNANKIMASKITTPTAAITITTAAGVTTHCTPTISTTVGHTQVNKVLHDSTITTQALMPTTTTYTVAPSIAAKAAVTETAVTAVATFQTQIPKVNLNEIYTPEDLQNLQKLIAKPADTTVSQARTALPVLMPVVAMSAAIPAATFLPQEPTIKIVQQNDALQHSNYPISRINHNDGTASCITDTYSTMSSNVLTLQQTHTSTEQHLPQQHQLQQQQQQQQQPPPLLIDKNILPLHVNNVKTVKKQMFCPKSLNSPTSIAIRHNNNNIINNNSSSSSSNSSQQQQQQQQQPQHYIQQSSSNYVSGMLPLSTMPTQVQQLIPTPLNVKNIDITRMGTLV